MALSAVRVTGSTAFSEEALARIVAPYVGREVSHAELVKLRDQLTLTYIEKGYVTSGATIPAQSLEEGVLEVRIIEGELDGVEVATDGRFRESVLRQRIARAAATPVNVYDLEEQLQILQQDPRIERVEAQLLPGDARGRSRLRVRVFEASPYWAEVEGSNHQSPTIGSWGGLLRAGFSNVSGIGDQVEIYAKATEGLYDLRGRYEIPITSHDTTLDAHFRLAWSDVVEEPFDSLDISSSLRTFGFELRQPVRRTLRDTLHLFLIGEWRRGETSLFGSEFSFVPGPDDGISKVTVLRLGAEWLLRERHQALALRSSLNLGIDALGATTNSGDIPDGRFLYWLGQVQYARRLAFWDAQVIARGDAQVSSRPLLGLERFVIGGHSTVRGYRENTLVRDNGLVGSLELRIPVLQRSEGYPRLELAPFFDAAYSWNSDAPEVGPTTLMSAGVGALFHLNRRVLLEAYWGERIEDVPKLGESSLQRDGVHVALTVRFP